MRFDSIAQCLNVHLRTNDGLCAEHRAAMVSLRTDDCQVLAFIRADMRRKTNQPRRLRISNCSPIGLLKTDRPTYVAFSRTTSFAFLSSLIPRKTVCRSRSSRVHPVNFIWQTITGL